jgi:hypothetical protein
MIRKGSLLSAEAGTKKARLYFERITDAQAAMTDIDDYSAAKIGRKEISRQIFDRKFSKICCKT